MRKDDPRVHFSRSEFGPSRELVAIRDTDGISAVNIPGIEPMWFVTRFTDVREVLGDHKRFRIVSGEELGQAGPSLDEEQRRILRAGNLLAFDPPEHTRLRRVVGPAFTAGRIKGMEPRIRRIVDEQLDAMARSGPPVDLVRSFATSVPALVICEILGVPVTDRTFLQEQVDRMLDIAVAPAERMAAEQAIRAYMFDCVDRMSQAPGDGLLPALIRQQNGERLSREELAGLGHLLMVAGNESTASMLALGTLALMRHRDELELLQEQPRFTEAAVEELLRWLTVVHITAPRRTTEDVEIAGQHIPSGSLVMCSLPAANRDKALIDDPDRLDLSRGEAGHIAFGHGIHHCLGAPLARLELRVALPRLLQRFPGLRATDDEARFRTTNIVYGLTSLEVTW
ncbi:cytochrome P450 [Nonomuraea sp. NPDC001023]|uniref:cytochrome P450 n=1 Tax=unclassified Nonomuraea TaxID=2593643 RepID=UPI00332A0F6A